MMNAAKFKTLRESLGLTPNWLAKTLKRPLKVVVLWESGAEPVPSEAIAILENLNQFILDVQQTAYRHFEQPSAQAVLLRYTTVEDLWEARPDFAKLKLPLSFHHMTLSRLMHGLTQANRITHVVYFNKLAYEAWLGNKGDNESVRHQWATLQL